jgi:hypothetical protein
MPYILTHLGGKPYYSSKKNEHEELKGKVGAEGVKLYNKYVIDYCFYIFSPNLNFKAQLTKKLLTGWQQWIFCCYDLNGNTWN